MIGNEKRSIFTTLRLLYTQHERIVITGLIFVFGISLICATFFSYNFLKTSSGGEAFTYKERSEWLLAPKSAVLNFASVPSTSVKLAFPAEISRVIAVGFHEAENPKAYPLLPAFQCLSSETSSAVRGIVASSKRPVFLILDSRNRKQLSNSAADVAVEPETVIKSPVDGEVTKVKTYYLYGKYLDYHVEIMPKGEPGVRAVLIHLIDVIVKEGDRVKRGETAIGKVHPLYDKINSQINRYIPRRCDHVHIQVNPAETVNSEQ